MDRSETVNLFRARLKEVIARSGESRAAFARRLGLDRSTLAQLLDETQVRLPRAETILAIAQAAQVSVDWLLGLSQQGQVAPQVMPRALDIEPGAGAPGDERLLRWHEEAAGYRIRYVPSTLPDLLKTEAVIRYEYARFESVVAAGRVEQAMTRLAYIRRPEADLEVACPVELLTGFARGEGLWRHLDWPTRRAQLEVIQQRTEELYPGLRWYLYDGLARYSVPFTLFGPLRAAVYFGNMYVVFNSTEHLRVLSQHFDDLVRAATIQPPVVPTLVEQLIRDNEPVRIARRIREEKR